MTDWKLSRAIAFTLVLVFASSQGRAAETSDELFEIRKGTIEIVHSYMAAFNDTDVAEMMELVSTKVEWVTHMQGGGVAKADGQSALRTTMDKYFAAVPTVRTEIEGLFAGGNFVSMRERVSWTEQKKVAGEMVDIKKSTVSISVYEIEDNLIRRVWYYPADKSAK